jgi:hypothetical protein
MKTYYFYICGSFIGSFEIKLSDVQSNYPCATVFDKGRSIELCGEPNLSLGLTA